MSEKLFPKKGASLELNTAAYFQSYGYLVRRGVVLSVAAGTAEATDIDLLAVKFGVPLTEERLIADCKDRKKPQTFERILWTKGLASFSQSDRCVVVTPRARWQAREFASQGGVEVLGAQEVGEYLKSHSIDPFGEANPEISDLLQKNKKRVQQPQDKELLRADLIIRQMLVVGHPLTNLNRLIGMLANLGDPSSDFTQDALWLRRYICFNLAVVASVMLVRFAIESKWTPEQDWSDHAKKRLTFGDVPPRKVRELTRLALDFDFFETLPSPKYTDEVVGLIRSLIDQPSVAAVTPYALDFYLLGQVMDSASEDSATRVLGELQSSASKVTRQILSTLSYAADVPQDIWNTEEEILRKK